MPETLQQITLGTEKVELKKNEMDLGISPQDSNWTLEKFLETLSDKSGVSTDPDPALASRLISIRTIDYQEGPYFFTRIIGTVADGVVG